MACICITTDYESALGKNTQHKYGGGGSELGYVKGKLVSKKRSTVRSNPMTKSAQADIATLIAKARVEQAPEKDGVVNFFPRPLEVWIHVVRPLDPEVDGVEKDIDPINFQSSICDAIEDGIRVNDSFYMSRVTWSVIKEGEKPRIRITITQEDRNAEVQVSDIHTGGGHSADHRNDLHYAHSDCPKG